MTNFFFLKPFDHAFNGFLNAEPVNKTRIDYDSRCDIGKGLFTDVPAFDHADNRKIENFRELIVAVIVSRNRHNRARAICREHII